MVSHEQRTIASRVVLSTAFAVALLATPSWGQGSEKKYYTDDPLLQEPPPRPVNEVKPRKLNETYDFLYNSLVVPGREQKPLHGSRRAAVDANDKWWFYSDTGSVQRIQRPARDVNTLGDVPNGSWYTNRHFHRRMSIEELKCGPGNSTPPNPNGRWRVVSAKSDGATPGFVIEDAHKNRYVLKLDSPDYPELASAADIIGSKFFYALGYNTPENYIVRFDRRKLVVSDGAVWQDSSGIKRPITQRVLDDLLKAQPTGPDGTYRALASRWIAGKLVGPFLYEGMRTDDPNDTVPHEDRRVLRGLRVFAAWLNHQDSRSMNTMDALVDEGGVPHLKHYLMDFGSILGSNANVAKDAWYGNEYAFENKGALVQIATLGIYVPKWARASYPKIKGVGLFGYESFDPASWKPTYPNPAFLRMDSDDAFWAAKQVAAFSEAEIRAIVETGEYSDPGATEWVTRCLIKRAAKIVEVWLSGVPALDRFAVVDGKLTFEDVRKGMPRQYTVKWATWDGNGRAEEVPNAAGSEVPDVPDNNGRYLVARVASAAAAGNQAVTVYLRRSEAGVEVVGVDR
jgi:hypothetical protein